MEAANNLVKDFCKSIGMDPLGLDEENQRSLAFDDKLIVTFIGEEDNNLVALCYIGDIKKEADARVFMEQNFLAHAHGTGRFALEPNSDRIVLTSKWRADRIDVPQFSAELEKFIHSGLRAQEFLDKGGAMDKPVAANEGAPAPAMPESMAHYQNML